MGLVAHVGLDQRQDNRGQDADGDPKQKPENTRQTRRSVGAESAANQGIKCYGDRIHPAFLAGIGTITKQAIVVI